MNWLITGGCGFIGANLIRALIEDPSNKIRVVDNLSIGSEDTLEEILRCNKINPSNLKECIWTRPNEIDLIIGDIRDRDLALTATAGADIIVHLAANTGVEPSITFPEMDMTSNVIGTFNYLEAARINGIKRFINASSGATVGLTDPPIHEKKLPRPISPYGASKLAGEAYCSAYFHSFNVDTISLRFGNVYGPGSMKKNSVVAKLIKKILLGEKLEIYGDGLQTRDYIFVHDLIQAIMLAASTPKSGGEIFQIATGKQTTLLELIEALHSIFSKYNIEASKPTSLKKRTGDVQVNFFDVAKAKKMLGWESKVQLKDGLDITVQSFLEKNGGN